MPESEFARILVEEIISKGQNVNKIHFLWESCGLDRFNLDDKDEIWKWYVKATLHWGGILDDIVHSNWHSFFNNSVVCYRENLLNDLVQMSNLGCFENFTRKCPVEYKKGTFKNQDKCYIGKNFESCLIPKITKDLSWHRHHYKTSKIYLESAKRLFILNDWGKINGNLNDVVSAVFDKHKGSTCNWHTDATMEFFNIFNDMMNYKPPAKTLLMFVSDMSLPFLQVNHWPDFDTFALIPIDTHVKRLSSRFGFVNENGTSDKKIKDGLRKAYPDEPRALNFAMFLLAGESEMNICTKSPKCNICSKRIPKVYRSCPYLDKF